MAWVRSLSNSGPFAFALQAFCANKETAYRSILSLYCSAETPSPQRFRQSRMFLGMAGGANSIGFSLSHKTRVGFLNLILSRCRNVRANSARLREMLVNSDL